MDFDEVAQDFKNIKKINWQPNWEPFMSKYQCDLVCELGVYKGDNFMEMIKHGPVLAVAVDKWKDDGKHPRKYDDYTQDQFDEQYEFFKSRVADKLNVRIVKNDTVRAADLFPDNYFDFVYIDANHSTESCYADIVAWYPKVKPGKFLAGHDYQPGYGVVEAVDRFVKETDQKLIFRPRSMWLLIKK